ncbi:hypothetical protein MSG28_010416 [Choristoneura fumiferana]|uniref:Uncharacterized protein n=1 Tax=Choristoneura fumiferana TaxID=7141 RepID=A0ACC0KLV9_CHOFU|nr:hypothetical protein MSG28_010416 [Choristoneura fumiferana]
MCIDYVLPKSGMYENHTVKYFVILETPEMYETDIGFVASALLISCVFLVIVLIVYALLPELRNLCGLILMSYVATITIYYFFLASFCWMNVMSFDIWWTFRGEGFKYGVYCVYSWGLPAAMTLFMVEIDSVDLRHIPWFIQPKMINSGCFIEGGGKFVYLYVPMLTVIVINWMFFLMTAFNIWRLSRGTALSVIMGVSWVLEVVSFLAPQFSVWYLTDAYNLLIGVSIFLIFICKKKIYNKLRKRYSRSKLIYLYGPIVILCIANMVFNEMFQISQSDSGDLRTIGNRDVKNWKEYQQQRGSLDTVRTSICCDSDNIRTTKTSSF